MRHIPVGGSLPKPTLPRTPRRSQNLQKRRVLDTCQQQPHILQAFRAQVAALAETSPDTPTTALLEQSWKIVTSHLPSVIAAPAQQKQSAVTALWKQRKLVSSLAAKLASLQSTHHSRHFQLTFAFWRAHQAMKHLQNTLRDQCRRRKRERINRLLEEAAGKPNSLPHIFQLLRAIAPKLPHRRVQFRADNGMPLSNKEALQSIHRYFYDLYNKLPDGSLADFPKPQEPFQVTGAELAAALAALPASKALPSHLPPAVLWKAASATTAGRDLDMLNHWLANMEQQPPDQWHIADIFLMPKPHKAIMAANLRPISLLHPIAKALASILKQKIQPAADKLLAASPQFAYMEHRSVADAHDRVLTHLVHVRNILQTQRQTPHLRQQGHTPAPCRGGITFSVDLQKAFDCMSRTHLATALEAAGVETSLRWTILQLHKHACMRFSHAAATTEIPTTNGIRQGCGLSPTLWAMFTQVVMQKICERLHQDGITVYADDWLFPMVCRECQ